MSDSGMASRTLQIFQFTFAILVVVVFEVDKKKETFPVTGKMKVEVPANCSKQELKEIENVLKKSIATSLEFLKEVTKKPRKTTIKHN